MTVTNPAPDQGSLRWLAASQTYFGRAGRWRTAQLVLVVVLPTLLAVYGAFQTSAKFWIAFLGFMAAILDATLFNWVISQARYSAAQLASLYDASLVGKPYLVPRSAGMPSPERVGEAAEEFMTRPGARAEAETWQYARISELKLPIAELLYIRSDVAQDEHLRESYAIVLVTIAFLGIVVLLAVAGMNQWDVGRLFSNVLFPIVPAAAWLGREIVDQYNALVRKRCLRVLLDDRLINEQMRDPKSDRLSMEREALHGMQFFFRSAQPSVAWWLHVSRRRRVRRALEHTLDIIIEDAIQSGHALTATIEIGGYTQQ